MATQDIVDQRLELIEQRLGETERAQRRIDWSVWSVRLAAVSTFALLMLAIVLVPYTGLTRRAAPSA